MKKNLPRNKINIRKETRKETKINSPRKASTQEKTIPHLKRMMIVIVNQKEFSLWH
jgi:hypothetical protein